MPRISRNKSRIAYSYSLLLLFIYMFGNTGLKMQWIYPEFCYLSIGNTGLKMQWIQPEFEEQVLDCPFFPILIFVYVFGNTGLKMQWIYTQNFRNKSRIAYSYNPILLFVRMFGNTGLKKINNEMSLIADCNLC